MNDLIAVGFGLSCALAVTVTPVVTRAQDRTEAFAAHIALATRNPSDFGFTDAEEARRATLGWSYAYYSTDEWAALSPKPAAKLDDRTPRRLTEVLGANGEPRCAFIQERREDGGWGPGLLGFKNLSDGLMALRRHQHRDRYVVLVDSKTRRLFFVDTDDPDQVQKLEVTP